MAKKTESVDVFMERLDYPLKAEAEALRAIIKAVDETIAEQIKWNAPSYRLKDDFLTFNFHDPKQIRLIFHHPAIVSIPSDILEGDYPDRRLVYFADMADVDTKTPALEQVIKALIERMNP